MLNGSRTLKRKRTGKAALSLRQDAVKRVLAGEKPEIVANELGYHRSRVYAWVRAYKLRGEKGLQDKPITGRPAKLDRVVWRQLVERLKKPCSPHCRFWTPDRLQSLIAKEYGFTLDKNALSRLLDQIGLGPRRLVQQLEQLQWAKMAEWLKVDYPAVQSQARKENAQIYLCTLSHHARENLYITQANSARGELLFHLGHEALTADDFIAFIEALSERSNKKVQLLLNRPELFEGLLTEPGVIEYLRKNLDRLSLTRLPNKNFLWGSQLETVPVPESLQDWVLLLNQSILDNCNSFDLFLKALGTAMNGIPSMASNLFNPGSLIRPVYDDVALANVISLNKAIDKIWDSNPFLKAFSQPGDLFTLDEILPKKQWHKNPYCRGQMATGHQHMIGLCFAGPNNTLSGLFICRQSQQRFTQQDRDFIQDLRPHLEVAMALAVDRWHNRFTVTALEGATDNLDLAAFVLDGNRSIIQASDTAQKILEEKQYLSSVAGKLHFSVSKNQKQFEQAVARAIAWRREPVDNKPVAAMRFELAQGRSVGVLVQAITPPSLLMPYSVVVEPHVVVYISDPVQQRPPPQRQLIAQLFDLSVREAQLTTLLTSGLTLNEAAQEMNITQATARTYLQHIYEKVGVKRQQDLVRRVIKSVALLA